MQQQTHQHHQIQPQHVGSNNGSATEYSTDDRIRDAHENSDKMQEKHTDHFINQSNIMSMTQSNENMTDNFLSHSHHPRVNGLLDGGGLLWGWSEGEHNHDDDNNNKNASNSALSGNEITDLENLNDETKNQQQSWEATQGKGNDDIDDKSFQQSLCMNQIEKTSFEESQKVSNSNEIRNNNLNFLKTTDTVHTSSQDINARNPSHVIKQENVGDYASGNMSIHDDVIEKNYKFRGDGGPAKVSPETGSWCCRRGGTEQPTPEHLKDGCCQGLQTKDEILDESSQKDELKTEGSHSPRTPTAVTTTTKLQDHLDKLKNNVRTEVPDCDCFPADKCELQLSISMLTLENTIITKAYKKKLQY